VRVALFMSRALTCCSSSRALLFEASATDSPPMESESAAFDALLSADASEELAGYRRGHSPLDSLAWEHLASLSDASVVRMLSRVQAAQGLLQERLRLGAAYIHQLRSREATPNYLGPQFQRLPDEVICRLIVDSSKSHAASLFQLQLVSRAWSSFIRRAADEVWRPCALSRFPLLRELHAAAPRLPNRPWRDLYREHTRLARRPFKRDEFVDLWASLPNPQPTPDLANYVAALRVSCGSEEVTSWTGILTRPSDLSHDAVKEVPLFFPDAHVPYHVRRSLTYALYVYDSTSGRTLRVLQADGHGPWEAYDDSDVGNGFLSGVVAPHQLSGGQLVEGAAAEEGWSETYYDLNFYVDVFEGEDRLPHMMIRVQTSFVYRYRLENDADDYGEIVRDEEVDDEAMLSDLPNLFGRVLAAAFSA
jgi:hypothetical protein